MVLLTFLNAFTFFIIRYTCIHYTYMYMYTKTFNFNNNITVQSFFDNILFYKE